MIVAVSISALAGFVATVIGLVAAVITFSSFAKERGWRREVPGTIAVIACGAAVVLLVAALRDEGDHQNAASDADAPVETIPEPEIPTSTAPPPTEEPTTEASPAAPTCDDAPSPPDPNKGPDEPNDDLTEAGYGLASGDVNSPQLDAADDEDWYAVCASGSGSRASATVINRVDRSKTDCSLDLHFLTDAGSEEDPAGESISVDADSKTGRVPARLEPNRLYYVKVRAYGGFSCPDEYAPYPYEISVGPADAFEK